MPQFCDEATSNNGRQIEKVADFCGLKLNRVPRVKDIEHEVDEAS